MDTGVYTKLTNTYGFDLKVGSKDMSPLNLSTSYTNSAVGVLCVAD
jgi:hypothetical protein